MLSVCVSVWRWLCEFVNCLRCFTIFIFLFIFETIACSQVCCARSTTFVQLPSPFAARSCSLCVLSIYIIFIVCPTLSRSKSFALPHYVSKKHLTSNQSTIEKEGGWGCGEKGKGKPRPKSSQALYDSLFGLFLVNGICMYVMLLCEFYVLSFSFVAPFFGVYFSIILFVFFLLLKEWKRKKKPRGLVPAPTRSTHCIFTPPPRRQEVIVIVHLVKGSI